MPAQAREEWFRGLDLESSVGNADLILVARVTEVSDAKTVYGGKAERTTQQVKFQPVRTLKGIFTRDELQLTLDDLGGGDEPAGIEGGQVRLLVLGRSGPGYTNVNRGANLDQSVPPLADEKDPFLETVTLLIAESHQRDRRKKIELLMNGLGTAKGPAAVVLLRAIQRRGLLAAQTPGIAAAISKHLGSESSAVREAATFALSSILAADYLDQKGLRTSAVTALLTLLGKDDMDLNLRLSALQGLASAGSAALNKDAAGYLKIDAPHDTFAERTTIVRGIGELKMESQRDAVSTLLTTLPLDAPGDLESAASIALRILDSKQALKVTLERLRKKSRAGLGISAEIGLIGDFPKDMAAPALVEIFKLDLNPSEKSQFAYAAMRVADARLVPALTTMLSPRHEELRWQAFEALNKIDTDEAARAMRTHLKEEFNLHRKLIIAAFLGRHGIRDGYPYAMEHVSEPGLTETAVYALAAIKDPRAVPVLRQILKESNDTTWNSAAIRALGALGEKEFAPQFLEYVQDLKNPLAPAALLALADLGEVKALPKIREALSSRNESLAYTSARAAGKLLAIPGVKADDLRDQLAALFADGDASEGLRHAALEALVAENDPRLDKALLTAVRDGSLENTSLLQRTEELLAKRKVKVLIDPNRCGGGRISEGCGPGVSRPPHSLPWMRFKALLAARTTLFSSSSSSFSSCGQLAAFSPSSPSRFGSYPAILHALITRRFGLEQCDQLGNNHLRLAGHPAQRGRHIAAGSRRRFLTLQRFQQEIASGRSIRPEQSEGLGEKETQEPPVSGFVPESMSVARCSLLFPVDPDQGKSFAQTRTLLSLSPRAVCNAGIASLAPGPISPRALAADPRVKKLSSLRNLTRWGTAASAAGPIFPRASIVA